MSISGKGKYSFGGIGSGGVNNHNEFSDLDFELSGHTGFVSTNTTQTIVGRKYFTNNIFMTDTLSIGSEEVEAPLLVLGHHDLSAIFRRGIVRIEEDSKLSINVDTEAHRLNYDLTLNTSLGFIVARGLPQKPTRDETVLWVSDGRDYAKVGDLCIASTTGDKTYRSVLFAYGSGDLWEDK